MGYPEATQIMFSDSSPAIDGGGALRDHAVVHTSIQIDLDAKHSLVKATIPIKNGLDKPVEVKIYGRTENDSDSWHQLGTTISLLAAGVHVATLTDNWRSIKMTVEVTGGAAATSGAFLAKFMPVVES